MRAGGRTEPGGLAYAAGLAPLLLSLAVSFACRVTPRPPAAVVPAPANEPPPLRRVDDPIVTMSLGERLSCAVHRSGQVSCRGDDGPGLVVPDLAGAIDVFAAGERPCAVTADGRLWCWEHRAPAGLSVRDDAGDVVQLAQTQRPAELCILRRGGGVTCSPSAGAGPGRPIGGFNSAKTIAGGRSQVCALYEDGRAACGSVAGVGDERSVAFIPGVTDARQLAVHGERVCVTTAAQAVRCWALTRERTRPFAPLAVPELPDAAQVVAGDTYVCVRTSGGEVLCWNPAVAVAGSEPRLERVAGLSGVAALYGGPEQLCARRSDGTVWCWGRDDHGQLGGRTAPDELRRSGVQALAATDAATCMLMHGGDVQCVGSLENWTRPTSIGRIPGAAQIAAGDDALCVRITTGHVACRGLPGRSAWMHEERYDPQWRTPYPPLADVVDVTVESSRACSLHGDGSVRCWSPHSRIDHDFAGFDAPGGVQIAATGTSVYVRTRAGAVRCVERSGDCMDTSALSDIVAISAGECHLCALRRGGQLLCGGCNDHGELGGPARRSGEQRPPVPVAGSYERVAASGHRTCAVTVGSREVLCWGGVGETRLGPQWIPYLDRPAISLAVGWHHACAQLEDGRITCWGGDNDYGELGNGIRHVQFRPVQLPTAMPPR